MQQLQLARRREAKAVESLSHLHRSHALAAQRSRLPGLATAVLALVAVHRVALLLRRPLVPLVLLAVACAVTPGATLGVFRTLAGSLLSAPWLPSELTQLVNPTCADDEETEDALPEPKGSTRASAVRGGRSRLAEEDDGVGDAEGILVEGGA